MRFDRIALQASIALCVLLMLPEAGTSQPSNSAEAEHVPAAAPKDEFRGVWIATVLGLDWPWSTNVATQKQQLVDLLDALEEAGINAVFFQIRSESDAFYQSDIEPWSRWLTGAQGRAPTPLYDPLEFAILEAHRRGMELHAWINPFRAERSVGNYSLDPNHVKRLHPDWIVTIHDLSILNPGLPEVRDYIISVIEDVVTRYDVDGIHFDDYFYPYPPDEISNEDQQTFAENNPMGFFSIDTWRLWNINTFVRGVSEAVAAIKPEVKFGISPFGIWRSGVPSGISGLSAVDVIYADAPNWLDQQWIDYVIPQLYWPFGGGQDYAKLAPWWGTKRNGRHLYIGHGLYRAEPTTFIGELFGPTEVPRQVRFNREDPDVFGSTFFRARNITTYSSQGFSDSLKVDLNRYPALVPIMDWKDTWPPDRPDNISFEWTGAGEVTVTWDAPLPSEGVPAPRRYAVYRIRSSVVPDFATARQNPSNLLEVTGETSIKDYPAAATDPYYYVVTSVSANSIESYESDYVVVEGRAVGIEEPLLSSFNVAQNYPNPFSETTAIVVDLSISVDLSARVYDAIGRLVAVLSVGRYAGPGEHVLLWDGRDDSGSPMASGTYFYTVEAGGRRITRPMVLVR